MIRTSLKAIAEQPPERQFFRCHKSYLINLEHIQKVEGNARNLELVLEHVAQKIPVSRTKAQVLSELLRAVAS